MSHSQPSPRRRPVALRPDLHLLAAALLGLGLGLALELPVPAARAEQGRVTGLPIPRFVSLRPDEVNLRTGPGLRYPIEWVYQRAGMPVEVIGEFETWRRVRDWSDTTGWVHEVMIQAKRTARITGSEPRLIRAEPDTGAAPVAMLQPGVIAALEACRDGWCRVLADGHAGWLPRAHFFGAHPGETIE